MKPLLNALAMNIDRAVLCDVVIGLFVAVTV